MKEAQSKPIHRSFVFSICEVVHKYFHLFLLLSIQHLIRAVNTNYVRNLLCFVGLSAILAEAEKVDLLSSRSSIEAGRRTLLSPRHEKESERLTIVLDLDETLVCAYNSLYLPPSVHNNAVQGGIRWFTLECQSAEKNGDGTLRVNNVTVYERPGLSEFLTRASQFAEIVLFTAGLEGYARPLVDRIDPEGCVSARLYRPATVSIGFREHVKDLSNLGRDLRRTVIVDNNPYSFVKQPLNGIPCVPFTGENAGDCQLLEVLLPLLQQLAEKPDVRVTLMEHFQMLSWFRNRGVPSDWPGEIIPPLLQ